MDFYLFFLKEVYVRSSQCDNYSIKEPPKGLYVLLVWKFTVFLIFKISILKISSNQINLSLWWMEITIG